jgi:tyrosyl-tRNA synthetase
LSINKNKIDDSKVVSEEDVIAGNMILLQRGKKNYFLVILK